MKVVQPITISAANIISSNLYETAPTAYAGGTTYGLNAYASVAGLLGEILIYRSLQAGNIGHTPSSSPTWWVYSSSTYVTHSRTGVDYPRGTRVIDAVNHKVYECIVANGRNRPLDISTYPVWIQVTTDTRATPADYNPLTTYVIDSTVYSVHEGRSPSSVPVIDDQSVFISTANGNLGNPPFYTVGGPWTKVPSWPVPYSPLANYNIGQLVQSDGKTYQVLLSDCSNCPVDNSPAWLEISPTNIYAPFDSQSSTKAFANKEITYVVSTGIIDTVGFIGTDADSITVTVRNGLAGPIVYTKTIGLTGGNPTNAWDYYFSDPTLRVTQAIADEIPPYVNSYTTITLTGVGTIGIGNILFGKGKDVGLAEYGVQSGIQDFSTKVTDSFGQTTFVQRGYKKRVNCRAFVANDDLNKVQNTLYALRATPCLWILSNDPKLSEALIIYGFYKDFSTEISYPTVSYINYEIEGLI